MTGPAASRSLREPHGFTLVEVMFGVLIASIVIAAGYTVMTSSQKATVVNDQATQMQQNARIAMDLIANDLKVSGFGYAGPVGACTAPIVPGDNNPVGADTGPDRLSVVVPTTGPAGAAWTVGSLYTGGPTATTLTLSSGVGQAMADAGFGGAGFALPQSISIGGVVTATVTARAGDALTLSAAIPAPATFPVGTQVFWLQCVTYDIATAPADCGGNAPCLRRQGIPVAEGIEDLQLAYACDGCTAGGTPDGIIDDQNASNTFDAGDFLSNNTWAAAPFTPDTLRLVRISIVARQLRPDPDWRNTAPLTVEDHDHTDDPGYDLATYSQLRRRVLTRTVDLRNLGH